MRCDEVKILVFSFVIFFILKILEQEAAAGRSSLACSNHVTISPPTDPSRAKMEQQQSAGNLPSAYTRQSLQIGKTQMLVLLTVGGTNNVLSTASQKSRHSKWIIRTISSGGVERHAHGEYYGALFFSGNGAEASSQRSIVQ
jgi:hypothetical protein